MALYYWNNQGRLGNLLFQYAAIEFNTLKSDRVICFDNDVFALVEENRKFIRIKLPKRIHAYVNAKFSKLVDFFAKLKLISSINPKVFYVRDEFPCESESLVKKIGFFRNIYQIKGFFQHDQWMPGQLKLKGNIVANVGEKLAAISKSRCKVAVHVRSTDYKNWIVFGKQDVTINCDWYIRAIECARNSLENPEFIFFTDDAGILNKMNIVDSIKLFNGDSPMEDLVAMSLCEHAILSPSTFSYWGAMLSYTDGKLVIAPRYWAGFRSEAWFPPTIETEFMQYLEVNGDF